MHAGLAVDFGILGPLEVRDDDRLVPVGQGHERALLLHLLIRGNQTVPADALVEALWGGSPPASAPKMLQVYVARLRKRLGASGTRLETAGGGYRIRVDDEEVDARRFERLLSDADRALESGDNGAALGQLDAALELWRGDALSDVRYADFAQAEIRRLEELRLTATECRLDAELALGRHATVTSEVDALVVDHPYREELRRIQALALYRSGRQAEALEAVRSAFADLDELGLEPGPELRALEGAILRHDSTLSLVQQASASERGPRLRRRLLVVAGVAALLALGLLARLALDDTTIASRPSSVPAGSIGVVDGEGRVVAAIPLTGDPGLVAVSGGAGWVTSLSTRTVTRIDAAERRVVEVVGLPATAWAVAAGSEAAWTANEFEGTVTRILAEGNAVTGPIRVTPTSHGLLALAVLRDWLWVASQDDVITRIDQQTLLGVATVEGLRDPYVLSAGEGRVWALQRGVAAVTEIDPRANAIVATIELSAVPTAVAAGEGAVWALVPTEGLLVRVDSSTRETVATVAVPTDSAFVATGAGSVWVATTSGELLRIGTGSNEVELSVNLAGAIGGLAVGEGHVWVTARQ